MFANFLGVVMKFCYELFNNYGLAIILFTILTKIVLLPLSILIQKDSIKMVKMQPKINRIKINYFGDKDRIAEETSKLYKEEHYNALTSLIPLVIQIILLFGVLEVVNHPLTHILSYDNKITGSLTEIVLKNNDKLDSESSSLEIEVVKGIQNNKDSFEHGIFTKINEDNSSSKSLIADIYLSLFASSSTLSSLSLIIFSFCPVRQALCMVLVLF